MRTRHAKRLRTAIGLYRLLRNADLNNPDVLKVAEVLLMQVDTPTLRYIQEISRRGIESTSR